MKPKADGQLLLEFRSPEEIAADARRAKAMADWLSAPSRRLPPPLPPLPGWEHVLPNVTRCEIMRSNSTAMNRIGKIIVIRSVCHNTRGVEGSFDEPEEFRENRNGRWVCEHDPMTVRTFYSMDQLRILPDPWVRKPPIYKRSYNGKRYR